MIEGRKAGFVLSDESNYVANFKDALSPEIIEAINPTYPRWEKKCIGTHWEEVDCDCDIYDDCMCSGFVPDDDAIWLDWWVPFPPSLFDLLPKRKWKKREFNVVKL